MIKFGKGRMPKNNMQVQILPNPQGEKMKDFTLVKLWIIWMLAIVLFSVILLILTK